MEQLMFITDKIFALLNDFWDVVVEPSWLVQTVIGLMFVGWYVGHLKRLVTPDHKYDKEVK